jgi:hypothetical protein
MTGCVVIERSRANYPAEPWKTPKRKITLFGYFKVDTLTATEGSREGKCQFY